MTPRAQDAEPEHEFPRMTLAEHLDELRARVLKAIVALVLAMVLAFVFWHPIWEFAQRPFVEAARIQGIQDPKLMSLDPGEGFLGILKLSFLAGVVLAAPIVLWQLWGFIAAGLYPHERRYVRIFFPISVGLFVVGLILAYVVLIPFGFRWLIGWNLKMEVTTEFRIDTYISTCLTMVFGMGLLFELPLVMLFLEATNLVSWRAFAKYWRVAILVAFIIGMIVTDPSPVTQIAMAVPLCGLYFVGIYGGLFVGEGRRPFRWYHSWPIVLGAVLITLMLVFADEINAWSARMFGTGPGKPARSAPATPGPAGGGAPGTPGTPGG